MMQTRLIQYLVLISGLLTLSSCSEVKTVSLYDESAIEPNAVAQLNIPTSIEVEDIDGQNVIGIFGYLYTPERRELLLAPGEHELTVHYDDIWEYTNSEFDSFKSGSLTLMFEAETGSVYRLTHPELENPKAMKEFSRKPDIWIEELPANDGMSSGENSEGLKVSRLVKKKPKPKVLTEKEESSLKNEWDHLSPEDRALFQQWLKERKTPQ